MLVPASPDRLFADCAPAAILLAIEFAHVYDLISVAQPAHSFFNELSSKS